MSNTDEERSDQQLMQQCREGDPRAFNALFSRYFNRLYRYTLHYIKNEDAAKEVVMDVMVRLWQKRQTVTVDTDLTPYLYQSTKNAIYNHWKKKALEIVSFDPVAHDGILLSKPADDALQNQEMDEGYRDGLRQLSPQSRLVFEMSREQGLTHAQIAEHLNLSVNTVKNHMKAALNTLRKHIKATL